MKVRRPIPLIFFAKSYKGTPLVSLQGVRKNKKKRGRKRKRTEERKEKNRKEKEKKGSTQDKKEER